MEEWMRLLWHINAQTNNLYEIQTQAEEILQKAEDFPPETLTGEQARFALAEVQEAAGRLAAAEESLRALRLLMEKLAGPEGGLAQ